jgi:hypothetical protein
MIKRILIMLLIAAMALLPQDVLARRGGGGGMRGGGMRAPSARPMPARPSAPAQRPTTPSNGFNFKNDMGGRPPTASQLPSGPGLGNRPGGPGNGGNIGNRPGAPGNGGGIGTRPPVAPIVPPLPAWGWNGGVIWYPAYGYWGGGFWGPWGWGAYGAYYGAYTYTETHEEIKSYEVGSDSPGAKMLTSYGLTQTQCGPSGLVVIFGPENSVICAQPNASVVAGEYDLDTTNLTIVPRAAASS